MTWLEGIGDPADLKALPADKIPALAQEIRDFLIAQVSRTGGHLGPNLGVVELTIALHRVFDSPHDTLVFDTGHQAYVHKLLTGRHDFAHLRSQGGLSGYPSRAESEHDVVENSHASTALSWADGIATARKLAGDTDRHTVAVVGDGALTGGMAWEAINNIAAAKDLPLVVVVNDNQRSYAPTAGGLADRLASLRTAQKYERFLDWGKSTLTRTPVVGGAVYETLHGVKKGIKDIVSPQGLFEDLGIKYLGPVDGHDEPAIEAALRNARAYAGPVLVHVLTKKGKGYDLARAHDDDRFHAVDRINPETGLPLQVKGRIWTDVFAEEIVAIGQERPDIVALTAAMLIPVGLKEFAARFPDRVIDVGIAEQHAATMAAGLAYGGMHPVVCLYATFLNRAFDQVLMDCALHRAPVTFVLDRAGITGTDGASHNGMWDLTITGIVPGMRIAVPRDEPRLRELLREAVAVDDGPTLVRYSKQNPPAELPALRREGCVEVLRDPDADGGCDVLIVAVGELATTALHVALHLEEHGYTTQVVDPRWVIPVPGELVEFARDAEHVVVIEDNLVVGGVGSQVCQSLADAGVERPCHLFGIPKKFFVHASRAEILDEIGLTGPAISAALLTRLGERHTDHLGRTEHLPHAVP